jgi:hypothetical protein
MEIKKIKPLLLDSYYISMLSEKYKKSFFWLKGGFVEQFLTIKHQNRRILFDIHYRKI